MTAYTITEDPKRYIAAGIAYGGFHSDDRMNAEYRIRRWCGNYRDLESAIRDASSYPYSFRIIDYSGRRVGRLMANGAAGWSVDWKYDLAVADD